MRLLFVNFLCYVHISISFNLLIERLKPHPPIQQLVNTTINNSSAPDFTEDKVLRCELQYAVTTTFMAGLFQVQCGLYIKCTFNAHSMHIRCTFNAHSMHIQCTFNAHSMHIQCTFNAHSMHIQCTFNAHSMHIQCTFNAHSMHIQCTFNAHSMHIQCTFNAHSMHIQCTINAQSMHIQCIGADFCSGRRYNYLNYLNS